MQNKELKVVPSILNLFKIVWSGGGEVPNMIKSEYTSRGAAELALSLFYEQKTANIKRQVYKKKRVPKEELAT